MVRPFHIMVKPVCGVCNLACGYCYYRHKPRELYPAEKTFRMAPEVLDAFTRQYLEALPERAEIGWQGGEPLLAGREFFQRAVEAQKQHARPGQTIANAIQTNGTLLDEAWCEFLLENKFLVGLSLDGPPQWHDAYRRDGSGGGSFDRAWAGLELLRKRGVEFNVLVTLHAGNVSHGGDLYRYFVNRGERYLQFIPILERTASGAPAEFSCTPQQYGRFLLEVFELWSARDVGKVSERFIDSVLHKLIFGTSAICCQSDRCANAFVLEYNGDLYACDHFVYERWLLGNILQRPLVELVTDPMVEEFSRLKTDLPSACRGCEFLEFCNGGCPKHHVPLYGRPERTNYFCEAYKSFFRAALPELRRLAEYFRRGEQAPPRNPTPVPPAGSAPSASARPHRNAPCPCGSGRKFKNCCGKS